MALQLKKRNIIANPTNKFSIKKLLQTDISFSIFNNAPKVKHELYEQLATMTNADLPLREALELAKNAANKQIKEKLELQCQALQNGSSLAQSMKDQSSFYTPFEISSIQAGEASGNLNEIFVELSEYYLKNYEFQKKLIGALTYPMFILVFAFAVIWFLLKYLVPMFQSYYDKLNGTLPWITQIIVDASNLITNYGWILIVGIATVVYGIIRFLKHPQIKQYAHQFLLKVPFWGNYYKEVALGRFATSMQLLLSSGLSLSEAMEHSKTMLSFLPLQKAIQNVQQKILLGDSLHNSCSEEPILDPFFLSLIKIGEQTGQLSLSFVKLKEYYIKSTSHKSDVLQAILEPFIIIFIGVIVGFILVAVYLPIIQMSSSVG